MARGSIKSGPARVDSGSSLITGSLLSRMRSQAAKAHANGERFNMRSLRTNNFLIEEEWQQLDAAILAETEERLVILDDVRSAGLTMNVDGLGVIESQYQRFGDLTAAERNMTGRAQAEYDIPDTDIVTVPIPITHKNFQFEWRFVEASRRRGESIDTTTAQLAARMVAESLELLVLNGDTNIVHSGNNVYGLTTHPDRETHTISTAWDAVTANTDIVDDILAMRALLIANGYYGPYMLYVPPEYEGVMDEDYKAESDITVGERVRRIRNITDYKVVDGLADNNVLLVQMTRDVLDLVVAQELTTIDWEIEGGMLQHFKVMAGIVPRVKSTFGNNCGVCHGSV